MEEVFGYMSAWGGISVVNAIPSGLGATAAVDMRTRAYVKRCDSGIDNRSKLVETILSYFYSHYGAPRLCVEIESDIPVGSGLKSSSSTAVALIRAIAEELQIYEPNVPRLAAELSRLAGVSVTGAIDDAAAAYYGGVALTDNTNMKVIRVVDLRLDLVAVILMPRGVSRPRIDVEGFRRYSYIFVEAFNTALQGDILRAMTLNGLAIARLMGYPEDIPRKALDIGALAAGVSGNGPAIFAVCRAGDEGPVLDYFSRYGSVEIRRFIGLGEKP